jgi:ectoine hydroxylase-related dioxygenase (phytanoyl-CoA dioxygenase family)
MNSIKEIENARLGINEKGYAVLKGVFTSKTINSIISEIDQASNVDRYFDRRQNERRIERIFDKGYNLGQVNREILKKLELIYGFEWKIFKDKFNAKPPGGEGFFAHFDGIFIFTDKDGKKRNGWYTFANQFVNALVVFDDFTPENGSLEVALKVKGTFQELLEHTKKDGSPDLLSSFENQCNFELLHLNAGDLVLFNPNCPHRSKVNRSQSPRRTLYYTYNPSSQGDHYKRYYEEKHSSRNINNKSLTGEY